MAGSSRYGVDDDLPITDPADEPIPVERVGLGRGKSEKVPEWQLALTQHPAWAGLVDRGANAVEFSEDRISGPENMPHKLAGDIFMVTRVVCSAAGYSVSGSHIPPLDILVTKD